LRSGKLQLLLKDWPAPDRPLYAAYAPGKHTMRKVRSFVDFIAEWFKQHPILESDDETPSSTSPSATSSKRQRSL
jgi:hypothetical protein